MADKVAAMATHRISPDLVIIARTDARHVTSFDDMVARANLYRKAGADVIFPEGLHDGDEFARFMKASPGATLANMTEFGKTPDITAARFGELGYRSVFSKVLFTRLIVFLVTALLIGAVVFAAMALAYRTRPVFVPTMGPGDPVARYRTAVMGRMRLFAFGVPALIGLMSGLVAQGYWDRIQLFLHGGSFGITDPQFGRDLGFYAFDLPFYRLVLTFVFVALFLALMANLITHYIFGGIRLAAGTGALSRAARIQLVSLVGLLVLAKAVAYWLDRFELLSNTRPGKDRKSVV
jgi:uncharacterized membrane protein (UPF0182 family)